MLHTRIAIRGAVLPALLLLALDLTAQNLSVRSVEESDARFGQLGGLTEDDRSFTVFPIRDRGATGWWGLYPVEFDATNQSRFRSGYNDGYRIPGAGLGTRVSAGAYVDFGWISAQWRPERITAELDSFQTFPTTYLPFFWQTYFNTTLNVIDAPERLGYAPRTDWHWGQSNLLAHIGPVSAGWSSENLWWGPGIRHSLLMTNNAPGFEHLTLHTNRPITTPIGRFEGQYIVGRLTNSGLPPRRLDTGNFARFYFRARPDTVDRVIMGGVLAWQPVWAAGLTLGMAVTDMAYETSIKTVGDAFPLFRPHRREPFGTTVPALRNGVYDRRSSVFFRYAQPESGVEVYGEFGREEMASSWADLLELPEHTRAYVIGAMKRQPVGWGIDARIHAEMVQTEFTATRELRPSPSWYTHHVIRHGYTHQGRVLGSGVGPGGSSQYLDITFIHRHARLGVNLERLVHNNDYYYAQFTTTFQRHWVDLIGGVDAMVNVGRVTVFGEYRYVRAYNYQYQEASIPGVRYIGVDRTNIRLHGGMRIRI